MIMILLALIEHLADKALPVVFSKLVKSAPVGRGRKP